MTRARQVLQRRVEHILEITRDKARHSLELAEMMCLSPYRVRDYLKKLRKEKSIYIERWGAGPRPGTPPMAFYRKGNLPDAPRPAPKAVPKPVVSREKVARDVSPELARERRQREKSIQRALARDAQQPVKQFALVNALFGRPVA